MLRLGKQPPVRAFPWTLAAMLVVALSTTGCEQILQKAKAEDAQLRVAAVLDGISENPPPGANEQASICRWWRDVGFIGDTAELSDAMDAFDRWRQKGGIYPRIASYEIVGSEEIVDAEPYTALVTVKINGRTRRLRVPDKQPIDWSR